MTSQSRAALAFSVLLFAYGCATGSDSLFDGEPSGAGGNGGTANTSGTSGTNVGSTGSGNSGGSGGSSASSSNSASASSSNSSSVATTSAVSSGTGLPNLDGGLPDLDGGLPGMCTMTSQCNVAASECCLMGLMVCGPMIPGFCLP